MNKRGQRKATTGDAPSASTAGMTFSTGAILSVVTGRVLSANHWEISGLLEYFHSKEMHTNAERKAALSPAADWIVSQLPWTARSVASLKRHKGDVTEWLTGQAEKHGSHHRLLPMVGSKEEGSDSPEVMDERDIAEPWDDARMAKEIDLAWAKPNNAAASVFDAEEAARAMIDRLHARAAQGDLYALHALNNLGVHATRCLGELGKHDLFAKTCVAIPADVTERRKVLEQVSKLRIGTSAGFPAPKDDSGKKTGRPCKTDGGSVVSFWRDIQFHIDAVRTLLDLNPRANLSNLSYRIEQDLLDRIAALPDFGSGKRDEWLAVGRDFVTGNIDSMVPDWLRLRAGKESGLPSLVRRTLKAGFDYCWPAPV